MKLGEICNRDVVFIRPDESALEAARLMRRLHVGAVVVAEARGDQRFATGIVTDRDLAIEILAQQIDPESVTAGDIGSATTLVRIGSEEDIFAGLERMRSHGVRRLPVVDDSGALLGIITMDDILELIAGQIGDLVQLVSRSYRHEAESRNT
jgi:CBS domain-containing protein